MFASNAGKVDLGRNRRIETLVLELDEIETTETRLSSSDLSLQSVMLLFLSPVWYLQLNSE